MSRFQGPRLPGVRNLGRRASLVQAPPPPPPPVTTGGYFLSAGEVSTIQSRLTTAPMSGA